MFKIELSSEIKELHKKYFEEIIVPKLQDHNILFSKQDIRRINKIYGKRCTVIKIQKENDDLIQYCIDNKEIISIGNFKDLKDIQNQISRRFPIIACLINKNFKFNKPNKYSGKKYWEVLFELFGYNKFCNCSLFSVIYDLAKYNTNTLHSSDITTTEDRKKVQIEMRYILKCLFSQIEKELNNDDNFNKLDAKGRKIIFNKNEFKNKLVELENDYSLALTIDNYNNGILRNVWNAYMFVFRVGIRTCPYCNRQYITPLLTSNGQVRGTLDHFLAKNQYPYFSMSLYNLVPVCYSCNSSFKGDAKFNFDDINPYEESMENYIRFQANIMINKPIHIDINIKKGNKESEIKKYLDTFKLEHQYNYHTNQVEELIIKRFAYPDKYIEDIKNINLKNFNITKRKIKEQLIGYTEDELKINDEPLTKFRRDIVEQLDFFDDSDLYLINKLEEILDENN